MVRKIGFVFVAVIALLAIIGGVLWAKGKSGAPPFLEGVNPNGFDDFVKATSLIAVNSTEAGEETEQLSEAIKANRPAREALRRGLELKVEAPATVYDVQTIGPYLNQLGDLKKLAQILKLEGTLAEKEGKPLEAARIYLEIMKFGQKVQSGPLISCLSGLAIEVLGFRELSRLEPELKAADRVEIANALEKLNRERVHFEEVVQRERFVLRKNSATPIHYLLLAPRLKPAIENARSKHERQIDDQRKLIEDLRKG
jgi:hypothetical protein